MLAPKPVVKKKTSQFVAESLLFVGAYPAGVARSVPQKHDIDSEAHTEHVRLPLNVFPPQVECKESRTWSNIQGTRSKHYLGLQRLCGKLVWVFVWLLK